jgi:hypothetical protein
MECSSHGLEVVPDLPKTSKFDTHDSLIHAIVVKDVTYMYSWIILIFILICSFFYSR